MNHAAICKNRKGESRNGLMGMGGIWMEMWGMWVRMWGLGGMSNLGHNLGNQGGNTGKLGILHGPTSESKGRFFANNILLA